MTNKERLKTFLENHNELLAISLDVEPFEFVKSFPEDIELTSQDAVIIVLKPYHVEAMTEGEALRIINAFRDLYLDELREFVRGYEVNVGWANLNIPDKEAN